MDTDQGSQVFASAVSAPERFDRPRCTEVTCVQLTQSTRYADARNAYREVQERHEDIKKIAQTMQELQQLFNDMAMLVERQDEQIQTIEATAVVCGAYQTFDRAIVLMTIRRMSRQTWRLLMCRSIKASSRESPLSNPAPHLPSHAKLVCVCQCTQSPEKALDLLLDLGHHHHRGGPGSHVIRS